MKKISWAIIVAASSLLLGARGCLGGGEQAFREGTRQLDAAKIDGIFIATRSGSIRVEGIREEKVECTFVRRARGATRQEAETAIAAIRIEESREGAIWRLQADFPAEASFDDASADFRLRVPARFSAALEAHNGEVFTSGIEGKTTIRVHNGGVKAFGARDAVKIRSFNGPIELQGEPASLDLVSHNGSMEIRIGNLRAFSKESSIESHNGSVAMSVPSGFSAALHALCGNGQIRVEAPGRWERRGAREWRGALGTGGPRLRVESHNGEIRIEAAK